MGVEFGFVDEVALTWFNGFHFEEVCKKCFAIETKVLYLSSSFGLLGVESHDFSQAERKNCLQ